MCCSVFVFNHRYFIISAAVAKHTYVCRTIHTSYVFNSEKKYHCLAIVIYAHYIYLLRGSFVLHEAVNLLPREGGKEKHVPVDMCKHEQNPISQTVLVFALFLRVCII